MQKILSRLLSFVFVLALFVPAYFALADNGSVFIDTINGNPPGSTCIAGAITVTGHGIEGSNGGPYHLDIDRGDGFITTIDLPSGGDHPFTFTATHTPTQVTTTFGVFLYHGSNSGNDAHAEITTFCATPPTTAVLTVKKHVVNDNGGVATAPNFNMHVKNSSNVEVPDGGNGVSSPTSGSETGKDFIITPDGGIYTISEDALVGYTQTGAVGDCATTLVAGNNYICTITNDDNVPLPSTLTLVKTVTNDNGGTAVTANFQGKIDGGNVPWASAQTVSAGAHTASETGLAGYAAGAWGGDCDADGSVTLLAGENKICTITNDDQQAYIVINKIVVNDNGGEASANEFLLKVDSNAVSDEVAFAVNPGAHVASETNIPGYTAGAWGGDCDQNGNVTAILGQTKTCIITNNDQMPSLTLNKELVQDNGGDLFDDILDFILSATGPVNLSGTDGVTSGNDFETGEYELGEDGPAGYTASTWECTGGSLEGNSLSIALGEEVNCTIVNDDNQATLTVIKEVENNDGGELNAEDFTLYIDSDEVTSGTENSLDAGEYTISEDEVDGYVGTIGGDCAADGSITLSPGEDATCTITNDDVAPGLTVIKSVTNDNGGELEVADFTLYIDASIVTSGNSNVLEAGSYVVSEGPVSGYEGTIGGDCDENGNVTLDVGDTKVCTITNDDVAPSLTLVKQVVNDNGGDADEVDWALSANGDNESPSNISGAGGVISDETFQADTYTLSETSGPDGYEAGEWSCVKDSVPVLGNTVTLSIGQSATCTIVNDDIAPSLTLDKEVINDDNGDESASAWELTASGPTPISGEGNASSGDDFDAGTYTLSESGPDGYTASDWLCIGGTQEGSTITLALGESAECTITNDDNEPETGTIVIVKNVEGEDDTFSFENNFVEGLIQITTVQGTGSETFSGLTPGVYSLAEIVPEGWDLASAVCSDESNPASIGLGGDETVTCIFTNTAEEVTQCSDQGDNDDDELIDSADPGCHTDNDPNNSESYDANDDDEGNDDDNNTTTSTSGSRRTSQGRVLGATTELCTWNVDTYMRKGYKNDQSQVMILQQDLLNGYLNSGLVVDGLFGPLTEAAVKAFQVAKKDRILAPWGLTLPTGIFYKTTLVEAKNTICPDVILPIPTDLINWSQNPGQVPPPVASVISATQ